MAGRILVAVKRVVDYNARVRVKPNKVGGGGSGSLPLGASLAARQQLR